MPNFYSVIYLIYFIKKYRKTKLSNPNFENLGKTNNNKLKTT